MCIVNSRVRFRIIVQTKLFFLVAFSSLFIQCGQVSDNRGTSSCRRRQASYLSFFFLFSAGSFPPTISPRKLLSLDNEALDNGILYPLSLNGLNSQGVSMATAKKLANSNGFYDCDKTETTSEKAVGYGRPRSWSQPVGLSLRCKRFNSGEKMNRENCSSTVRIFFL